MVIKGFVTLGLITRLDDMFAAGFPQAVKDNANALDESGIMKMEQDNNTTTKVFKRFWKDIKKACSCTNIVPDYNLQEEEGMNEREKIRAMHKAMKQRKKIEDLRQSRNCCEAFVALFLDLLINLVFNIYINLLIIFFNYFGGILVIFVQIVGFYYQQFT